MSQNNDKFKVTVKDELEKRLSREGSVKSRETSVITRAGRMRTFLGQSRGGQKGEENLCMRHISGAEQIELYNKLGLLR